MRILILGADGFIGRAVTSAFSKEHDVYTASRDGSDGPKSVKLDLLDKPAIGKTLDSVKPEIIINCAGVVENSDKAKLNIEFTHNLLETASKSGLEFKKIFVSGSASEYGVVSPQDIPVKETTALNPNSIYGQSKAEEVKLALDYQQAGLPVVVGRIFNPIGVGMHPRFLIPSMLTQLKKFKNGEAKSIEVSRLDSKRDYINVKDVARAIKEISEKDTKYDVYNIGTGQGTSNRELINILAKELKLEKMPSIAETSRQPEQLIANQADITRLRTDLGWQPVCTIEETVKEIVDASG